MAIIPLRMLGMKGLNSDIDPRALPLDAWNEARNVRFEAGSIIRAPRFRLMGNVSRGSPTYVTGHPCPQGGYEMLIGYRDGGIMRWSARGDNGEPGVEYDVTPTDIASFPYDEPTTSAVLQDVIYWNRPDRVLLYMQKNGSTFAKVPNWDKNWRCKSIRTINGQTIAIGVQRDGRTYPTMIKASDYAAYGSAGAEWIATTTNSASENILGGLGERLIDGLPLRNNMMLYSEHETWLQTPNLSNSIYDYSPVFHDLGVISQNCAADVANTHYVFGPDAIWKHDGTTSMKISTSAIQDEVYKHLVSQCKNKFFVTYLKDRNEVMFCFISNDPNCKFKVGAGNVPEGVSLYPGCNKAVIYNTFHSTWSVSDLPYVAPGCAIVSPYGGKRWEEMTTTWADTPGSWDDYADHSEPVPLMVTNTLEGTVPVSLPITSSLTNTYTLTAADVRFDVDCGGQVRIPIADLIAAGSGEGVVFDNSAFGPASVGSAAVTYGGDIVYSAPACPTTGGTSQSVNSKGGTGASGSLLTGRIPAFGTKIAGLKVGDIFVLVATDNALATGGSAGTIEPGWTLVKEGGTKQHRVRIWTRIVDADYVARIDSFYNPANEYGNVFPLFNAGSLHDCYLQFYTELYGRPQNLVGDLVRSVECEILTAPTTPDTVSYIRSGTKVSRGTLLMTLGYTKPFGEATSPADDITMLGQVVLPRASNYANIDVVISGANNALRSLGVTAVLLDDTGAVMPVTQADPEGYLALTRSTPFTSAEIAALPTNLFANTVSGTTTLAQAITYTSNFSAPTVQGYDMVIARAYGAFGRTLSLITPANASDPNFYNVSAGGYYDQGDPEYVYSRAISYKPGDDLPKFAFGGVETLYFIRIIFNDYIEAGTASPVSSTTYPDAIPYALTNARGQRVNATIFINSGGTGSGTGSPPLPDDAPGGVILQ